MYSDKLAYHLAYFSREAYTDHPGIITRGSTQVRIIKEWDRVIIAFRGTESDELVDWLTDLNILKEQFHGKSCHSGFVQAYRDICLPIRRELRGVPESIPVYITGHSLGAALATLCAFDFWTKGRRVDGVYTYGSPRVGGKGFRNAYRKHLSSITFRHVNHVDMVCKVPTLLRWRHVGKMVYFDRLGRHAKGPSYWEQFIETLKTLGKFKASELFKDHNINDYMRLIQDNFKL